MTESTPTPSPARRAVSILSYVAGGAALTLLSFAARVGPKDWEVAFALALGGAIGGGVLRLFHTAPHATRGARLRNWALSGAVAGVFLIAVGLAQVDITPLLLLAGAGGGAIAGMGYCWQFYGSALSGPELRSPQQIVRQWFMVVGTILLAFGILWFVISAS